MNKYALVSCPKACWSLNSSINACISCVFRLLPSFRNSEPALQKASVALSRSHSSRWRSSPSLALPLAFQSGARDHSSSLASFASSSIVHHQSFDSNMSSVCERPNEPAEIRRGPGGGGKFTGCDTKLFFEGFCDCREPSSVPHGAT